MPNEQKRGICQRLHKIHFLYNYKWALVWSLNNSINVWIPSHKLTFITLHFGWNLFWILLSDFCEFYLPKINYGLLVLQKLSINLETQSRQLQRGKGSAVTFFYQIIFKKKCRKFCWQVGLLSSFIIAVSCRCVFPIYATHVVWVLIRAHGRGLLQRYWATSAFCVLVTNSVYRVL